MKAHVRRARGLQPGDEPAQLLDADRYKGRGFDHAAAADRFLLFALPEAIAIGVSFSRARKPARKASAIREAAEKAEITIKFIDRTEDEDDGA